MLRECVLVIKKGSCKYTNLMELHEVNVENKQKPQVFVLLNDIYYSGD